MLVKNGGDKIPNPSDSSSGDEPDDADNEKKGVLLFNSLYYSVNSPYDINAGKAEDNFDY